MDKECLKRVRSGAGGEDKVGVTGYGVRSFSKMRRGGEEEMRRGCEMLEKAGVCGVSGGKMVCWGFKKDDVDK